MGHGRAQTAGPGPVRALRLGLPALRRRAGFPRGNRTARTRPAGTRRPAVAAAGRTEVAAQKGLIPAFENLHRPAMSSPQPSALSPHHFSATDHAHMARALRLAERGLFTTQPNPRVGCVIAHAESIVG